MHGAYNSCTGSEPDERCPRGLYRRKRSECWPGGRTADSPEPCGHLLALWGLGAAARGVGAGAAVGLDVSAGSLVLQAISILDLFANRPLVLTDMLV